MAKTLIRGAMPGATGWNKKRTTYKCADGADLQVPSTVVIQEFMQEQSDSDYTDGRIVLLNGIRYEVRKEEEMTSLIVSGTELNRSMSRIAKGAEYVWTITFPKTIREVLDNAF